MANSTSKVDSEPRNAISVLLQLTRVLTEDPPLEEALRAITDAALCILPGDHASLRLLDAGNKALLCGARSGVGLDHRPITFKPGDGVMGWAVANGQSVRVDDTAADERFLFSSDQGFAVRSLLVEPLKSAGRVIGVLSVSAAAPHAFSDEDQLLCRLLANCSVPPNERARLERLAMTDDMTLAYNVRYMMPRLKEEIERARRNGLPLSVALMDLDHFKNVNDAYGHAVGDHVLRLFANEVRSHVRRIDVLVRRGGEEFLLIMPQTGTDQARAMADRIRQTLAENPLRIEDEGDIDDGLSIHQTVSIGVATWDGAEQAEALERRADAAMYASKTSGRDRVSVAPLPLPGSLARQSEDLSLPRGTW